MRTTTLLVAASLAAGCVQQDEAVGTVGAALTATDDSGATYRLPTGSYLALNNATYSEAFSLDGGAPVVHIPLPIGTYDAWLWHDLGYGAAWPLERTAANGDVTTVTGYLLTPMPLSVDIFEETTTSLVITFEVPEFGDITFAEGALDVTTEIDTSSAGGAEITAGSSAWIANDVEASLELAALLPAAGDSVELNLGVTVAGPWVKAASDRACAPAVLSTLGAVHPGVIDLVLEANGTARVCVFDREPAQLWIFSTRFGPGGTPTFDDLPGDEVIFTASVTVDLPAPVFDGKTLDLDPISGAHGGAVSGALEVVGLHEDAWQPWYLASLSGPGGVTVTLTP